jgi:hypothetical protein
MEGCVVQGTEVWKWRGQDRRRDVFATAKRNLTHAPQRSVFQVCKAESDRPYAFVSEQQHEDVLKGADRGTKESE